ncbi:MAG: carboxylate-amine ligase [Trueperaceae bacterium]|nr:MAG: carboxylate-amine ligase [Trueperaceae bacterium]
MYRAPLTIGIEEEYQIIDPNTRELTSYVQQMLKDGRFVLGSQVTEELMQSQIEIGTQICRTIEEARFELSRLRRAVAEVAERHGFAIAAAGTHPFSRWEEQQISESERYQTARDAFGIVARSLLIFGMHIHIGFGTSPQAYAVMLDVYNQMRYALPHILALTTSSPFWEGRDTGLKSYRSVIWENAPRTGIPPTFRSYSEYEEFVDLLGEVHSVGKDQASGKADKTMIWWDARPRPDLGTIEIRVSDMCTTIDEAICIAAICQAMAALFIKLRERNQSWRIYRTELIEENKWRALRYGIEGNLIDFGKGEEVPARFLMRELTELLDGVAAELGTREEIAAIHTILERGTSADRQLATYRSALADGASNREALLNVVDQLIEETRQGL